MLLNPTVLLAAASLALARDGFVLPPVNKPLDVSSPITISWNRPDKPSAEWVGLVEIVAFFDWSSPDGKTGDTSYDVAVNRSSDEPGEVLWDPREIRAFVEANATYGMSIFFSGGYNKDAPGTGGRSHESRGWLTDNFRIEGHALPSATGIMRASLGAVFAAAAVTALRLL